MNYNKLVRDRIPEIIQRSGAAPITHIADEREYWRALLDKLAEELAEFEARPDADELADVLEVIYAIGEFSGFTTEELERTRQAKRAARGGFTGRVILERTDEASGTGSSRT